MERLRNDQDDDGHEKVAQRSFVMRLIILQGCLAVCVALSTTISVGLAANLPKKEFTPVTPFIISDGFGVWVGLLLILTSAVGWGALYSNGRCFLVAYFSLILVALVFCLLILITCLMNAVIMSSYQHLRDTSIFVWRTVMLGLVAFFTLLFALLSIILSGFLCYHWNCRCCNRGCCCCDKEENDFADNETSRSLVSRGTNRS